MDAVTVEKSFYCIAIGWIKAIGRPHFAAAESLYRSWLEQAGDTVPPKIELYKRFKPFVEDILPGLITADRPAFVAHPYAEQPMPYALQHPCTIVIGPEGGFIPYELICS